MLRTRFAPSPTGYLHVGGARTALFCWLLSQHQQGKFILRIEDTDRERSTAESVQAILDGMQWLGLSYDEGPFYQTQRFDRYRDCVQQLLDEGKAYRCYCSKERLTDLREQQMADKEKPRYDGHCRHLDVEDVHQPHVIRFKNPEDGVVAWDDLVKGRIEIANRELDDLIIARSDGTPTYNFTVVIDDWDMQISHVVRGDDHVNNTPRQINLLEALGAPVPAYGHVPMILGEDGKRLSKRHGAVSVMAYRDLGFLPAAMLNYLVRLGWSHGDQEILSLDEMISAFTLKDVSRSPAAFNHDKLRWLNQHYLKTLPLDTLMPEIQWHFDQQGIDVSQGPDIADLLPVMTDRVQTLVELAEQGRYFYQDFEAFDEKAAKKHLRPVALEPLQCLSQRLSALSTWDAPAIHAEIEAAAVALDVGMGKVGMPLRVAVTGAGQSPAIDVTLQLIGKARVLARLEKAIAFVEARSA